VGYGDQIFKTEMGRLFVIFWLIIGCISLGRVLSRVIDNNAQKVAEQAAERRVKRLLRRQLDYEQLDRDNKGKITRLDFLIYQLTSLGRVEEWQVHEILNRFDSLDVNNKGELNMDDFKKAQEKQIQEVRERILRSKNYQIGTGRTTRPSLLLHTGQQQETKETVKVPSEEPRTELTSISPASSSSISTLSTDPSLQTQIDPV